MQLCDRVGLHGAFFGTIFKQAIEIATRAKKMICAGEHDGADVMIALGS